MVVVFCSEQAVGIFHLRHKILCHVAEGLFRLHTLSDARTMLAFVKKKTIKIVFDFFYQSHINI